jgi:hypothetical protein
MKHHRTARIAMAGLLLGVSSSSATILVTEPFDYNVGIFAQDTTTNDWIGTMGGSSGTGWAPRNWFSHTPSGTLQFGIGTGGHTGTFADSTGLNNLTNEWRERNLSPAVHNNTDGSVIWQHLTMSRSGSGSVGQWTTQNSSGGMQFAVRIDAAGNYALLTGQRNTHIQTSTIAASTDKTAPDTIVVKMENQTDASSNLFDVSMWINPTAESADDLPEPDLKIVGTTPFNNGRDIGSVNWMPGNTQVDNFILATTYEDFEIGKVVAGPLIVIKDGSTTLNDGSSTLALGAAVIGSPVSKQLTITNAGTTALTLGAVSFDGAAASQFSAGSFGETTLEPAASTTLDVTFTPTSSGAKTAAIHIVNDSPDDLNPFDITLTGTGLSYAEDGDGDGLSDAAEFALAALGFDWQTNQTSLVNALFSGAPSAGLYTTEQVRTQNSGVPLLERDLTSGEFLLTLSPEVSTDLETFEPVELSAPAAVINDQGQVELILSSEAPAAFFRIRAN